MFRGKSITLDPCSGEDVLMPTSALCVRECHDGIGTIVYIMVLFIAQRRAYNATFTY